MMPPSPLITLTTDFGLQDPFGGIMKGVIAGICPSARLIDITHSVTAFDIFDGALAIWQAWRYFPAETIHLVVVDPGVGSDRKPALTRMGNHWFVAPDNGVLTVVEQEVRRTGSSVASHQIANPKFALPVQSSTFHGRDIFAPAAAHLAAQIQEGKAAPETFGSAIENLIRLTIPEPIHHPDGSIEGVILKADRFGNLLTNLPACDVPSTNCALEIGSHRITRFARHYAELATGEIFVIPGSSGLLEIAMNKGSALHTSGIAVGTTFRLRAAN